MARGGGAGDGGGGAASGETSGAATGGKRARQDAGAWDHLVGGSKGKKKKVDKYSCKPRLIRRS